MAKLSVQVKLKNVRVSFLNVFEPRAFERGGKLRYSAVPLIAKTDPQAKVIQKAILDTATSQWGDRAAAIVRSLGDKDICLRDGDLKFSKSGEPLEGYAGHWALSANCNENSPPAIYRKSSREPINLENRGKYRDEIVYSGCYANVLVSIYAQDKFGLKVNCGLEGIMFEADGEPFGGGMSQAAVGDAFSELFAERPDPLAPAPSAGAGAAADDLASIFG